MRDQADLEEFTPMPFIGEVEIVNAKKGCNDIQVIDGKVSFVMDGGVLTLKIEDK